VRKKIDVARAKNETSAELKRVFPEFVLMMAGFLRSLARFRIVAAQEMKKIGGLQLRCAIGVTLFVNQEGKSDPGLFAELPGINGVAEANCGESCSFVAEGLFVFAQLRDMLATKDSAVVTQENNDGGPFVPQGAESCLAVVTIGKGDKGELVAEGSFHATPILCSAYCSVKRCASAISRLCCGRLLHPFPGAIIQTCNAE
jgi:predicted RecA/RadA family phage recombinase